MSTIAPKHNNDDLPFDQTRMSPPPLQCAAYAAAGRWEAKSAESRQWKRSADSAVLLSRGSGNISAVNGQNRARRLTRQRETDERLRDVFGQNLPAQKIASEIVVLGHATRLRAFLDQCAG